MSESILTTTKKALDVPEDYDVFDGTIIMHINAVFSTLTQLGIGPVGGFEISDASTTWTDYIPADPRFNNVKSYMYLRVRYLFDPPGTSFLQTAVKEQISELEWRISSERETRSTLLVGGHKKITGSLGDEYRIRLTNPDGHDVINTAGTYEAEFLSRNGFRPKPVPVDSSQRADGILFVTVTINNGTYTIRRVSPRRTILTLDVSAT